MARIPCAHRYANGKRCPGYITAVERYKVSVEWSYDAESDAWSGPVAWDSGTHFHLFCSAVGEHRPPLKLWGNELPEELQRVIYPGDRGRG
jgi:hypothetical protein